MTYEVKRPPRSVVASFLYRQTLRCILSEEGAISRLVLHRAPYVAFHPSASGSSSGASDLCVRANARDREEANDEEQHADY